MSEMSELSLYELERERGDLLPARETLSIVDINITIPINIAAQNSVAVATAWGGHVGNAAAVATNSINQNSIFG